MVDSEEVFVEVHRREGEKWTINTFEPGDTIILESLGIWFPGLSSYRGLPASTIVLAGKAILYHTACLLSSRCQPVGSTT